MLSKWKSNQWIVKQGSNQQMIMISCTNQFAPGKPNSRLNWRIIWNDKKMVFQIDSDSSAALVSPYSHEDAHMLLLPMTLL
mmetsp:Transcript_20407/g.20528  ORF Transcript_20407/g.20528 Transcript_20407/m.20528 type:complete len:81 (-) Transcript_20407:458-700(-)